MNKLKQMRVLKEKSQAEIAQALGLTQQAYSRYELNDYYPPAEVLAKIADYYGVSVDYLMERTAEQGNAADIIKDRDFAVIHRAYNMMSGKEKDKLKQMLALTFDIAFERKNNG